MRRERDPGPVDASDLPPQVRNEVEGSLSRILRRPAHLSAARSLRGGCINPSACIETDSGESFFLKWNAAAPTGMFEAEADGLTALAACARASNVADAGLHVPEVLDHSDGTGGSPSWLLLQYLPPGPATVGFGERLGRSLALLHRAEIGQFEGSGETERYGWWRDGFIGSLSQENQPSTSWPDFWRDRRLAPQLDRARSLGFWRGGQGASLDRLLDRVEDLLSPVADESPSLLHGDLWGGNVFPDVVGTPVLIDPAVYRGHREVDLAMSELFGFPDGFLEAYREAWPIDPAYEDHRRDLYQLYYLLVHVNLFGAGYVPAVEQAAARVLGAL